MRVSGSVNQPQQSTTWNDMHLHMTAAVVMPLFRSCSTQFNNRKYTLKMYIIAAVGNAISICHAISTPPE